MSAFDMCNVCDLPVTHANAMGYCDSCLGEAVATAATEPHASDCNVWVEEPCSCALGGGL
jgi:hypothetical protein